MKQHNSGKNIKRIKRCGLDSPIRKQVIANDRLQSLWRNYNKST